MPSEGGERQQPDRLRPRLPAEGQELTQGRREIFGTKRRGTCRLISFSCFLLLLPHVWAGISAVSPQNGPMAGGRTITILGGPGDFGKVSTLLRVRMGGSAASSTTWLSETSILAILPAGSGSQKTTVLTMQTNIRSTLLMSFCYDDPSVSRVARANGRSVGDYMLTVFGLNFGATNLNARARIGTACVSTTWLADTALSCRLPAGMGTEIPAVVTIAASESSTQRRSTASRAFSYDAVVLGSWTFWEIGPPYPYNRPAATGGGSISVIGSNFGNADYSNRPVIGGSACQVTHWRSDSVLTCQLPAGVGRGLSAVVELGHVSSGIFSRPFLLWFTYGAPVISGRWIASDLPPFNDNGKISNSPTSGNVTVTMSGFNFGRADYTSRSRVGGTVSYRTDWLSDTQVLIVIPPGICNNVEVSLTVARQVDTHTRAWSYDAPRISPNPADPNNNTVIPPNSPTTGGMSLTLFGANFGVFGYSGNGKYGGTAAEASRWSSDSSAALKSPAGVGGSLPVAYAVCGRETIPLPGQQRVSYNLPIVTDHTPHNGPTAGSTTITLFGSNFGKADYSPRAALGTFANATLTDEGGSIYNVSGATACLTTRWNSETSTSCRIPPGAGVQYGVSVTVGVQVGTQQTVNFFSYDSPAVVHVLPGNGPAFGGENVTLRIGDAYSTYSVTVQGRNFGMADYSPKVRLGDTDCMAVRWLSDTSIVCKIPGGAGKGVSISVTLRARNNGTQFGVGAKFSYDAPAISNINASTTSGNTTGGSIVQINGKNFGPNAPGYSIEYRLGSTQMNQTTWVSDTFISGIVPAGVGKGLSIGVLVFDQWGTILRAFSYYAPFGCVTGNQGCGVFKANYMSCPMDNFGKRPKSCDQTGSSGIDQTGGSTVFITGSFFGSADYSAKVRFKATAGMSTNWTSDTSVEAVGPAGAGSDHAIVLTVAAQVGTNFGAFCYDVPFVTSAAPTSRNRPTTGGSTISMLGVNFGTARYSPAGRVFWTERKQEFVEKNYTGTACMASGWVSFSSVSCQYPAGIFGDHIVRFEVCGVPGSSINQTTFSYDRPNITGLGNKAVKRFGNAPATGLVSVTVTGLNFGTVDYTARVSLGGLPAGRGVEGTTCSNSYKPCSGGLYCDVCTGEDCTSTNGFCIPCVEDCSNATRPEACAQACGRQNTTLDAVVSTWTSDSSILALLPAGLRGKLNVYVSYMQAQNHSSDKFPLFTTDGPTISGRGPINAPTGGAVSITITGANYGTQPLPCKNGNWSDDDGHDCLIYENDPTLCPDVAAAAENCCVCKDGKDGFGALVNPSPLRVGGTAAGATLWFSDSQIVGRLSPGVCTHRPMVVSVMTQLGSASGALSFDKPEIFWNETLQMFSGPLLRQAPDTIGTPNAPTAGAGNKNISVLSGHNFGASDYSARTRVGRTGILEMLWLSDTAIAGMVAPGVCHSLNVSVVVCEQSGMVSKVFTYNSPSMNVSNFYPTTGNFPTTGKPILTLSGQNFGVDSYSVKGGLGFTEGESTVWFSESAIVVKIAAGINSSLVMVATVCQAVGTQQRFDSEVLELKNYTLYSYNAPEISSTRGNGPATGRSTISVGGRNFGTVRYSGAARIGTSTINTTVFGATAGETTNWISDTCIRFNTPGGVSHLLGITFTVAVHIGTSTGHFTYDVPRASAVASRNGPVSGQNSATILGANFGVSGYSPASRFRGTAVMASLWTSTSAIVAKVATGVSESGLSVVVTVGDTVFDARAWTGGPVIDHRAFGTGANLFSYDAPTLTGTSGSSTGISSGGSSVTIGGLNLGTFDSSVKGRIGGSASQAITWISDTQLTLKIAAGCGGSKDVAVTVCTGEGTISRGVSYDEPYVSSLAISNGVTAGIQGFVTVTGKSFAVNHMSPKAVIGFTVATQTIWRSDSSVRATPSAGVCTASIQLTVCIRVGTLSLAFTYDNPVLRSVRSTNAPKGGGASSATISGTNFATYVLTGASRIGPTAARVTDWRSNTAVLSMARPGHDGILAIVFTACGAAGTITRSFTYDSPAIIQGSPVNGPTTGGVATVQGINFGTADYFFATAGAVRFGGTACEATLWVSNTHLSCKYPAGSGGTVAMTVSVGVTFGTSQALFTYNVPASDGMKTLSGQNGPATGGTSISISGQNFGASDYTPKTIVGGTVCDTLWMSDTLLVCKTRAGVGKDVDVSVGMQGAQTGTVRKAHTYDAPSINSVADPNGPGTGGNTVSISGSNFGSNDYSAGVSVGRSYPIKAQSSRWVSDTMLMVKMPSGGGVNFDVTAVIVDRMCTLTRSYSYDAPVISQINQFARSGSVKMNRGNSPQGGGANPIVFGKNFGSIDLTLKAKIGGTKAISSSWTSDSSLSIVTAPGVDTSATVNVYLDGVYDATLSRAFTFDGPRITAIVPHSSPAGSTITILGANMGVYDTSSAIMVGNTACEAVVWQSLSGIVCKTPPGLGRSIPVTGSFVSGTGCDEGTCFQNFTYDRGLTFSYSGPIVTAALLRNGPQSGGTRVTILGAGFGFWDLTLVAKSGRTACTETTWESHSSLTCLLPRGVGMPGLLVEERSTGETFSGSKTDVFQFDAPNATGVLPANAPGTGGSILTVMGSNFGSWRSSDLKAKIGPSFCTSTTWTSDSSLTCTAPAGLGGNLGLSIELAGTTGILTKAITFDGFYVDSLSPVNSPTAGGGVVTMTGAALGTADKPPTVKFGSVNAQVKWTSETSLEAIAPASVKTFGGTDISIEVDRIQFLPGYFSYDNAEIQSVTPSYGELAGGSLVTVKGKNFGGVATPLQFWIGDVSCSGLKYISDVLCTCTAPASAEYKIVSVTYAHAEVQMNKPSQNLAAYSNYSDYVLTMSAAYEYKACALPSCFPVSAIMKPGAPGKLELPGGNTMDVPAGAFSTPVEISLAFVPAFKGAEPSGTDKLVAPLLIYNAVSVDRRRQLALQQPPPTRRSVPVLPSQPMNLSMAVNLNRRLTTGIFVKLSWLNKCTGSWIPTCGSMYSEETKKVSGAIPVSVFNDTCFNPSTGCTPDITNANQCQGLGGTFSAISSTTDPCPAPVPPTPADTGRVIAIAVGVTAGVLCLALGVYLAALQKKKNSQEQDVDDLSVTDSDDKEVGSTYSGLDSMASSPRLGAAVYMPSALNPGVLMNPFAPQQMQMMEMMPPYASQTAYGQIGLQAVDPLQYTGNPYGGYNYNPGMNMGGRMNSMDMDLPPPVFAQGMGSGSMSGAYLPHAAFQSLGGSAAPSSRRTEDREL